MNNIGVISYTSAAVAFLVFALLLITSWRGRLQGALLVIAILVSLVWAAVAAYAANSEFPVTIIAVCLELLRDFCWALFLIRLTNTCLGQQAYQMTAYRVVVVLACALPLALLTIPIYMALTATPLAAWLSFDLRIFGHIMLAVVLLALIEQLYRNTPMEGRWGIKLLCLGLGLIFAFDFYLYSDSLLFKQLDIDIWYARGLVNAMAVPLIAVAVARNPEWSLDVFVSRGVVFYSSALLFAGIYLIAVAGGGYYLRLYGGDWGEVGFIAVIAVSVVSLCLFMLSGQVRARVKVFVNKHFFNYKYDYRQAWLGFIRRLSDDEAFPLEQRAIHALADFVDSPGGALWVLAKNKHYQLVEEVNFRGARVNKEATTSSLVQFLEQWQWVINLNEFQNDPQMYQGLNLPEWLVAKKTAWLVVPLLLKSQLYGFVVLLKSRAPRDFNWEDIDLLRMAGRQVAIHLAQSEATRDLVEARQFEAFNRLSAYVMHDLKNLMSQLALVVKNAEKHKRNPAFMDDAIDTVDNAVARMNRLLAQLRSGTIDNNKSHDRIQLSEIVSAVLKDKANGLPVPSIEAMADSLWVALEADKLASILGHVIQNAQDATAETGEVSLRLYADEVTAIIEVKDSGCGMDDDFIKNRLFQPFDTTKGLTGMGIGAHEVKAYIENLGGEVSVESEVNVGTTFRLTIPLSAEIIV